MRIKCQIEVLNNSYVAKNFGATANEFNSTGSRSTQAILFLTESTLNGRILLVYCTVKDKQEIKHELRGNVKNFVTSYTHSGKAAIQLHDPLITICVSEAQPSELKLLLKSIELVLKGNPLKSRDVLSYILPSQARHVSPTNKMIVLSRQDYRFALEFPTTLKSLILSHCGLSRIDSRIATLKSLVELNLSSNNIQDVSEALSGLNQLLVLDLSRNEIEHLPSSAFLQNSKLTILDLSHNKLKELPNSICNLMGLCYLNISFNRLRRLPADIRQLRSLRTLRTNDNKLKYFPMFMSHLPAISSIDFYGNDFVSVHKSVKYKRTLVNIYKNQILSLQQLCGRVIRNKNLFYNNIDVVPYPLIRYLNHAVPCLCQSYCFEENVRYFYLNQTVPR